MFGTNPVRPQELNDGQNLWVQEVFYTLQGEGPLTGHPAVFVRLCGCNLKCFFCDTDFESSDWRPELVELLTEIEKVGEPHCKLVVITGGEPFRQNIRPLIDALLTRGYKVQIETNGTLWVDLPRTPDIHIVCSPKSAYLHPEIVERANAFKYVINASAVSEVDGLPAKSTQSETVECNIRRPRPGADVYVMPMDSGSCEVNAENTKAAVLIAKQHGYRFTMQVHKTAGFR